MDLKKIFIGDDDDDEADESTSVELTEEETKNVNGLKTPYEGESNGLDPNASIVLFEPRNLKETEVIGKFLKSDKACFVNLNKLPAEYRGRAADFLSGVIFGIGGYNSVVGKDLVLFSPVKLKVTGRVTLGSNDTEN